MKLSAKLSVNGPMNTPATLLLSSSDVSRCLDLGTAIECVKAAFRAQAAGRTVMPAKITLDLGELGDWPHLGGSYNAMPAYVDMENLGTFAGVKWISGYEDNVKRGLPFLMSLIILNDPSTGFPLCIMDGTLITEYRTGAAAAIAAWELASKGLPMGLTASTADPSVPVSVPVKEQERLNEQERFAVTLVGAGAQGKSALRSMAALGILGDVSVVDIREDRARSLAEYVRNELGCNATASGLDGVEAAVRRADVIVTATTANEPLVHAEWTKPGNLVIALGSYLEVDERCVTESDAIVVDHEEQVTHRGTLVPYFKSGVLSRDRIRGEISRILAGETAGRRSPEERILAVLIGMAIEDIAVAGLVYRNALKLGVGTRYDLIS